MELELPKVNKVSDFTPEQMKEYIKYVATMRHNQRRWFNQKNTEALNISRKMEKELDDFNTRILNPAPDLFNTQQEDCTCNCFSCPKCLPPAARINGKMCLEQMNDEEKESAKQFIN